jgi:hypothetical protein
MIIPTYCCGEWRNGRCHYCPVLRARERAIHSVEDHTQQWWREEAFKAADRVMRRMESFTTDDIWIDLEKRGVESPHEPRAMGPIVRVLTGSGEIKFTGAYTQSVIPRGHGRTVKIYTVIA